MNNNQYFEQFKGDTYYPPYRMLVHNHHYCVTETECVQAELRVEDARRITISTEKLSGRSQWLMIYEMSEDDKYTFVYDHYYGTKIVLGKMHELMDTGKWALEKHEIGWGWDMNMMHIMERIND